MANFLTATRVQVVTHCPGAIVQSLLLLVFVQTSDANTRDLLLRWKLFFRRFYEFFLCPASPDFEVGKF